MFLDEGDAAGCAKQDMTPNRQNTKVKNILTKFLSMAPPGSNKAFDFGPIAFIPNNPLERSCVAGA
jgi:hypothetical protein